MLKIFKNFISFCVICLIGIQSINFTVYYTLFKINQQNLTEEVCEQIVKDCNACCYFDKKVSEQSDNTGKASKTVKAEIKILEYTVDTFFYNPFKNRSTNFLTSNTSILLSGHLISTDHPPRS